MRWTFNQIHAAFDALKDILADLRNYFNQLAYDKQGSWLLKDITALLNGLLYKPLWDVRLRVHDLRDRFDDVGDYLVNLDVADLIEGFFDKLPWSWSYFVDEPWGWFTNQAFKIDPTLYFWLVNPVLEVKTWFIKTVDNGRLLIDDPPKWVMWQLGAWWSGFANLYYNSGLTVEMWLTDRHPELADFFFDMDGWAQERIEAAQDNFREWVTGRMLHILQEVIERTWEGGEAE